MEKLYKVQTRFLFHSNIKIKIPSEYEEETFDTLFGIMEEINSKYNSYSEGSFIDKINKNSGNFTDVNEETIEILEKVIYYSEFLKGEYDITVMPFIKLWGFYKEGNGKVPSPKEIRRTGKLVDYRKIVIDRKGKKVKLDAGQEIITGSFIKSYAVDKVIEKMKGLGIKDAIINAGGSNICAMSEREDDFWEIVAENPHGKMEIERNEKGYPVRITEGRYLNEEMENDLFDVRICNESYSTSNQVNTYIEIDGEKYGHIISPKTGFPSRNMQIGIITEKAFIGDMISTGLYNQSPEDFYAIMKELQKELKIEGYLIDEKGNIHYSEGFLNYVLPNS